MHQFASIWDAVHRELRRHVPWGHVKEAAPVGMGRGLNTDMVLDRLSGHTCFLPCLGREALSHFLDHLWGAQYLDVVRYTK